MLSKASEETRPYTDNRTFGSWKRTIPEAVECILRKCTSTIPDSEKLRLRAEAAAMQARCQRSLPSGTKDSMALGWLNAREQGDGAGAPEVDATCAPAAPEASPPDSTGSQPSMVQWVHQIYGLYGDSKPMTPLFKRSQAAWTACATMMGAQYHLWGPNELETLMRTKYPQFWDMYVNVRYPIMRVDIGRIAILHAYGGIYADLDTLPNRQWYAQARLAVCSVWGPPGGGYKKSDWREEEGAEGVQPRKELWDMEVLVGALGEPVFLRWLGYIREQIESRSYDEGVYRTRRMRYVYHTTGPYGMQRFLSLKENKGVRSRMMFLSMNWFKDAPKLTPADWESFDIRTTESNSYFTKKHAIHVPVGHDNVAIPSLPKRLPTIGKSKFLRLAPRSQAPVEDVGREDESRHAATLKKWFQSELQQKSVSLRVTLENMPDELRAWLLSKEGTRPAAAPRAAGQGGSPTDRPTAAPTASRQPTPPTASRPAAAPTASGQAQPPPAAAERERTRSPRRPEVTDVQARRPGTVQGVTVEARRQARRPGTVQGTRCSTIVTGGRRGDQEASSQVLQALGRLEERW